MWQQSGFINKDIDIKKAMEQLSRYIVNIPGQYKKLRAEELVFKPAPGKWSKQEILGHLIDSAMNNLKRFAEIQFLPQPYQVISYLQNECVIVNNYQHLPLAHLLQLWQSLNQQIIYVVQNIPPEKLDYNVNPKYDNNEIKSLGWIIADYVAHLEHHATQVFP